MSSNLQSSGLPAQSANSISSCPECGEVLKGASETYCKGCGLVVEREHIDRGVYWTSDSDRTARHSGPGNQVSRHDQGLATEIGYEDDLSEGKRRQLERFRKLDSQSRISTKTKSRLVNGLVEIRRVAAGLDIGKQIRERGAKLFKSIKDEDMAGTIDTKLVGVACLHCACRLSKVMRPLGMFADETVFSKQEIRRTASLIRQVAELPIPPLRGVNLVPYYTTQLGVPGARKQAQELAHRFEKEYGGTGYDPYGIAAASIYAAIGGVQQNILSQREIANELDISPQTLSSRFEQIQEWN